MKALNLIAMILLIIGGLNWGLMGLFNFDLVAAIFGGEVGTRSAISRVIYVLVGLAALYGFVLLSRITSDRVSSSRI
jgi:uncharacterized protein